ncbi:Hypothetical protein D9617_1g084120 [Elsinoe fawcettii]|nr:Hypothetical protein D9617_1g084120 [Elsinoe fawcettii]
MTERVAHFHCTEEQIKGGSTWICQTAFKGGPKDPHRQLALPTLASVNQKLRDAISKPSSRGSTFIQNDVAKYVKGTVEKDKELNRDVFRRGLMNGVRAILTRHFLGFWGGHGLGRVAGVVVFADFLDINDWLATFWP